MNSEASSKGMNKAFVLVAILLALLTIGIIGYVTNSSKEEAQSGGFNPGPPPPGEAPPGKVWSYEHGHWHNAF